MFSLELTSHGWVVRAVSSEPEPDPELATLEQVARGEGAQPRPGGERRVRAVQAGKILYIADNPNSEDFMFFLFLFWEKT